MLGRRGVGVKNVGMGPMDGLTDNDDEYDEEERDEGVHDFAVALNIERPGRARARGRTGARADPPRSTKAEGGTWVCALAGEQA